MHIWMSRDRRVFARFWSRGSDVDQLSFEILGMPKNILLDGIDLSNDSLLPEPLRSEYREWIEEQL